MNVQPNQKMWASGISLVDQLSVQWTHWTQCYDDFQYGDKNTSKTPNWQQIGLMQSHYLVRYAIHNGACSEKSFPLDRESKTTQISPKTKWLNFAPGKSYGKIDFFWASILAGEQKNLHFSTSQHWPALPVESWELPFVFSFKAPLGLSIKKEFAGFQHTS